MTLQTRWLVDGAILPGQTAGRIVHFYVSAQDGLGATAWRRKPARIRARSTRWQTDRVRICRAHELRLIQLDADRDFMLINTNVMSQARLGGTVIYDRTEVFYDVAVRLHGSAAGRARDGEDYISYDIEFPGEPTVPRCAEQRGHRSFREGPGGPAAARDLCPAHVPTPALPAHHSDLCYFIAPTHRCTPARPFSNWAPTTGCSWRSNSDEEGSLFNLDLTYEPSTTVGGDIEAPKLPVPLAGAYRDGLHRSGHDKEQYRAPFDIRFGERADDYTGIMRLAKVMGLPQAEFDAQIASALDVDEALRLTALTILCGIGDTYFSATPSLPHNWRIFTPADGGPAQFLPWDMDFVFTARATGVDLSQLRASISPS